MAKGFTMAQLQELLDIHENAIIQIFINRIENLESKITSMQKENKQLKGEVFFFFLYMSIYLHFTLRKIIDKKTDIQNYTIARYQYTRKYLGV